MEFELSMHDIEFRSSHVVCRCGSTSHNAACLGWLPPADAACFGTLKMVFIETKPQLNYERGSFAAVLCCTA